VRRSAAERLRELGHAVVEARDGPDALRVLATTRPDLLVTDVGLPRGMNGRQVAEAAALKLAHLVPGVNVAGALSAPFAPLDQWPLDDLDAKLRHTRPHILWVGLGAPKQELWMAMMARRVQVPVMIGVGAALDFLAGTKRAAPRFLIGMGLEWLFRLATEPRRLWRRYLRYNPRCSLASRDNDLDFVVEAKAERVMVPTELEGVAAVYRRRYDWPVEVRAGAFEAEYGAPSAGPPPYNVYRLEPLTAYAFGTNDKTALVAGIVVISLVVLTGWGGQISLGQFGFVAIGAAIGGTLVADVGVPFIPALVGTSALGGAIAVAVGLPAMRIQGLFLAVTTLAFAAAMQPRRRSFAIAIALTGRSGTTGRLGWSHGPGYTVHVLGRTLVLVQHNWTHRATRTVGH
jgi:exopolysaccharide biosynthesis WecB/TagA/CpsF family protein